MPDLTARALLFADAVHDGQLRKYTNEPYIYHLAQVAGFVAAVGGTPEAIAAALLHDCREDQGVTHHQLVTQFGSIVAGAVSYLSDLEPGSRAERHAASLLRLASAPSWVQTIKVADIISNAGSIARHDPSFAVQYLKEKREQLAVLTQAAPGLLAIAAGIVR